MAEPDYSWPNHIEDRKAPMPNQPKTPLRSFRVPDDTYKAAQAKAAEKGESVSDVVRRALQRYARR